MTGGYPLTARAFCFNDGDSSYIGLQIIECVLEVGRVSERPAGRPDRLLDGTKNGRLLSDRKNIGDAGRHLCLFFVPVTHRHRRGMH
jgi:hypothetical protein